MDLTLIGPDRRDATRIGEHRRARVWLTVADLVGITLGVALAAVLILAAFV